MQTISSDLAREQLLAMITEGYRESQLPYRYFTDHEGLQATLAALDSNAASRRSSADDPASTIAAHAGHLCVAFDAVTAWLEGTQDRPDWSTSWSVSAVTEPEWHRLREKLAATVGAFETAVQNAELTSPETFGPAFAMAAHLAYHIGRIREKLARLPETPKVSTSL